MQDGIRDCRVRGVDLIKDSRFNQSLGFSNEQRQVLGVNGLLPARVMSQDDQVKKFLQNLHQCTSELERFRYAMSLYDRDKRLFFRVVTQNIREMLPLIYTPTIGLACQNYSLLYEQPRGLYITINDKGKVYDVLSNWPERNVQAIVVTDGERILGLGDLGANGMGIPVGKLALYTAIAGVDPNRCLPITLDVGTNNENNLNDHFYIGLKQRRDKSQHYIDFVDEFMEACVRRFGNQCLIQFEDFGPDNAFQFLDRYRNKYLMFNDDIQGTAVVAAAGVLAAMRVQKEKRINEHKFVFLGAGQASSGIASLLVEEMVANGVTEEEASSRIYLMDSKGLVVKNRPDKRVYRGPLSRFVKDREPITDLVDVVKQIKPTVLIGASSSPGAFNEAVLKEMASNNERPVVLALSNPTSRMECTAEDAYRHTDGRAIFASGSPCDPVTLPNGKTLHPGQANNSYVFPAIGLAAVAAKAKHLPDSVFLRTCRALANEVKEQDLANGLIYPPLETVGEVTVRVAANLVDFLFREKLATYYPEPADKVAFIRSQQYQNKYDETVPGKLSNL